MKKKYWMAACLSSGLILACGGDDKKDSANNDKYPAEIPAEVKPMADLEQAAKVAVHLGNYDYQVSIHRYPDKSLPLVIDELDQKFYDNCVEINILRDGEKLISRKVFKSDFAKFLSESDYKSGMLLGMNCDTARCNPSTLYFTAQVGQAGEGPAFLILVPTNGEAITILRDESQEEIGYQQ